MLAPFALEYEPTGHATHCPLEAYCPETHPAQLEAPGMDPVPIGQGLHSPTPSTALYVPAGHAKISSPCA